jgi:hypothetical protein
MKIKDQIEELEEEEDDEGIEFKTIPIAEAVKLQKAEKRSTE